MNIFLRAKGCHLFILTLGIPILFQFVNMIVMISGRSAAIDSGTKIPSLINLLPIVLIIVLVVTSGWIWSVGVLLQKKLPKGVILKLGKFKFFSIFSSIYFLVLTITIGLIVTDIVNFNIGSSDKYDVFSVPIFVAVHLISTFSYFYSIYFVAKTIKSMEIQKEAAASDYLDVFVMIIFFPLGILKIQPRINNM